MQYEEILKAAILPELEQGRPNWDKPHTETVVKHLKSILSNHPELDVDADVLIIAAYAHDWGYAGMFSAGEQLSFADVSNAKSLHMHLGAEKLTELLKKPEFDSLTDAQKARAIHLVGVHDSLDLLKTVDEIVLMEADTLAGLDVESVEPSFDADSNAKYMGGVRHKRLPLFMTSYGKAEFERLYRAREDFYSKSHSLAGK